MSALSEQGREQMKLSEAIEQAKRRAHASGHVGYVAHPTYDVWAIRNIRGVCSMDIRPRCSSGVASTMHRVKSKDWKAIVSKESEQ